MTAPFARRRCAENDTKKGGKEGVLQPLSLTLPRPPGTAGHPAASAPSPLSSARGSAQGWPRAHLVPAGGKREARSGKREARPHEDPADAKDAGGTAPTRHAACARYAD